MSDCRCASLPSTMNEYPDCPAHDRGAHERAELARLQSAIDLHVEHVYDHQQGGTQEVGFCEECNRPWPCRTVYAATGQEIPPR